MASASPEPMNRPRMPKNAPLDTVMLVPVRGPMIAVGSTASVPTAVPTAIEVTVCQKLRPNRIAKAPKTTFVQVRLAPRKTAAEIARPGVAGVFGQVLDACCLDRADAVLGQLGGGLWEGCGHELLDSAC